MNKTPNQNSPQSSEEGELCQRCGERGEDRRTLWVACFYAMGELQIPFEQCNIHGYYCQKVGEKQTAFGTIAVYADPDGRAGDHQFFTLRVCKDCRASWMGALQDWFNEKLAKKLSTGSGIFVRENGATVEISEEEWYRRNPNREPVRVRRTASKTGE